MFCLFQEDFLKKNITKSRSQEINVPKFLIVNQGKFFGQEEECLQAYMIVGVIYMRGISAYFSKSHYVKS